MQFEASALRSCLWVLSPMTMTTVTVMTSRRRHPQLLGPAAAGEIGEILETWTLRCEEAANNSKRAKRLLSVTFQC